MPPESNYPEDLQYGLKDLLFSEHMKDVMPDALESMKDMGVAAAEAFTPYGDAVALNDWKEGKLSPVEKLLTTVGLFAPLPNAKRFSVRSFKSPLSTHTIEALVNPTADDIEKASKILAKEAKSGNIWNNAIDADEADTYARRWRAVVDSSSGDVYAWPALDAIHNDVIASLAKETGNGPKNFVGFMTGDRQWDSLFDPKVNKKGIKFELPSLDQSSDFLKGYFGSTSK